jgi:hypothetical protein
VRYIVTALVILVLGALAVRGGGGKVVDALTGAYAVISPGLSFEREPSDVATSPESINPPLPPKPLVSHVPPPEPMYAIYMTQCAVGTPSLRDSLVKLLDETELNAVVIDIKDYSGTIAFPPQSEELQPVWQAAKCGALDMKEFVASLHEKGIYVIGRITVFQDPYMTKLHPERSVQSKARPGQPWKDHKGLSFIAVNSEEHWRYIVTLARESYELGFDELNFDYVRWPSDGPMGDIVYPSKDRAGELEKFFAYLHKEVKGFDATHHGGQQPVMSADLFGYTTVLTDDLGIGQQLERALPYFDYIAPMVYPSHYNKGFAGLKNPNDDPYKVIHVSMVEAVRRTVATESPVRAMGGDPILREETVPAYRDADGNWIATTTKQVETGLFTKPAYDKLKLRPWLQDFDYGKDYLPADIAAQIKATEDAGLTSWYFWDPANRYDSLKRVVDKVSAEE